MTISQFTLCLVIDKRSTELKKQKVFDDTISKIIENFGFNLTNDQLATMKLKEIYHHEKMFRILQGDVGSGKLFCL